MQYICFCNILQNSLNFLCKLKADIGQCFKRMISNNKWIKVQNYNTDVERIDQKPWFMSRQ